MRIALVLTLFVWAAIVPAAQQQPADDAGIVTCQGSPVTFNVLANDDPGAAIPASGNFPACPVSAIVPGSLMILPGTTGVPGAGGSVTFPGVGTVRRGQSCAGRPEAPRHRLAGV